MKIGLEVEGRMLGLRTLFLSYDEFDPQQISQEAMAHDVHQVYISDLDNKLNLYDEELHIISTRYILTIERTVVGDHPDHVNIMLQIQNESVWNLKKRDQVKFTKDNHVYALTMDNMIETLPEDFFGDVIL